MKKNKLVLLVAIVFILTGGIFVACNKSNENTYNKQTPLNLNALSGEYGDLDLAPFNFPEGTTITETDSSISFTLPEGYLAYGIDQHGQYNAMAEGEITCKCTSGNGGCSPGKYGSSMGCVMTTCGTCEKSGTSLTMPTLTFRSMIILNLNQPMAFFESAIQLHEKILLPEEFFDLDIITEQLEELQENLISSSSENTKIVPISIYGYVVMIEIPEDIDTSSPYAADVNCNCNSSGSCPLEKKLIVTYCDASSCSSCTMTTSVFEPITGVSYLLSASNYRILIQ